MPNTLVSSCTDLSHMQPSQEVMMAFPVFHKRHGAIIHVQCTKPRPNVFAPLWRTDVFEPASFSILNGSWPTSRGFLKRFHSLLYGKLSYFRGAVKQTLFLASVHLPLSDMWQLASYQWWPALSTVGRRAEEECEEHQRLTKRIAALCTCTDLRPHRWWQGNSVKRHNSDSLVSLGCLGQLMTGKSLQH